MSDFVRCLSMCSRDAQQFFAKQDIYAEMYYCYARFQGRACLLIGIMEVIPCGAGEYEEYHEFLSWPDGTMNYLVDSADTEYDGRRPGNHYSFLWYDTLKDSKYDALHRTYVPYIFGDINTDLVKMSKTVNIKNINEIRPFPQSPGIKSYLASAFIDIDVVTSTDRLEIDSAAREHSTNDRTANNCSW